MNVYHILSHILQMFLTYIYVDEVIHYNSKLFPQCNLVTFFNYFTREITLTKSTAVI